MIPAKRYLWIRSWLEQQGKYGRVDVLDSAFVCSYADATGAKSTLQFFGAPKCPQLGRDLGHLFKIGVLSRSATGLSAGDAAMGFPKWVWSYKLSDEYRSAGW